MKRYYIVEDADENVVEYCQTLHAAKWVLEHLGGRRIIACLGTPGQGFYRYILTRRGNAYSRERA